MGDVLFHSQSSAKLFGGLPEDYAEIHRYMDDSKVLIADWRHRALNHHSGFIAVAEKLWGPIWTRGSDKGQVSTRTIVTQHIQEDLGCVPTFADWMREMPLKSWMNGVSLRQKQRMQRWSIEGDAEETPIRTTVTWAGGVPKQKGLYNVCFREKESTVAHYTGDAWETTDRQPLFDTVVYWAHLPPAPVGDNDHRSTALP